MTFNTIILYNRIYSILSELTDNVEFLPDLSNGIIVCRESPEEPLKRVIKDFDGTVLSEQMEKDFLEKRKCLRDEYALKVRGSNISGVLSSTVAKKRFKSICMVS